MDRKAEIQNYRRAAEEARKTMMRIESAWLREKYAQTARDLDKLADDLEAAEAAGNAES